MSDIPSNTANNIATQSYIALNIDQLPKAQGGFYSKYNTQASQTFGGAVSDGLFQGMSQALPEAFKTDVQVLSDFRLGTFLRRHGVVSGDTATLINGVIDFLRPDSTSTAKLVVPNFHYTNKFIPIVIKTEFKLQTKSDNSGRDNFYVVFDSTPDSISFSKNCAWTPKDILGRPEPIQIFTNSSAITFSLTGMFFSDSPANHLTKLDLERKLFALVTPSKNHFMPSPVEVRIGEWKRLRCVVTSVVMKYDGPWRVSSSVISTANTIDIATTKSLPSHSPYMYEVTFGFTVVSEFNTVQYAEDIIDNGSNGGYASSNDPGSFVVPILASIKEKNKYENLMNISIGDNNTSIIYNIQQHAGEEGTVVDTSASFANTTAYLKSLGLPTDSNGASKLAGLAEITSGLTAIVETALVKNYGNNIAKIFGR